MDVHIGNDDTQTYGPALRRNLERAFKTAPDPVHTFVNYLIEQQRVVDERMQAALLNARKSRGAVSSSTKVKSPMLDSARKVLSALFKHLGCQSDLEEWRGEVSAFFPKGLTGIGKTGASVQSALATAIAALEQDTTVPDHAGLLRRLKKTAKDLDAELLAVSEAALVVRHELSEQSDEKLAWLRVYQGNVLMIEGLLKHENRGGDVATIVPHLAANTDAQKAAEPAEPAVA